MPCARHCSANSAIGVAAERRCTTMLYEVKADLYMQKPSWCLAVKTRYFWPLARASATQAAASNLRGLNLPGQRFVLRDRDARSLA